MRVPVIFTITTTESISVQQGEFLDDRLLKKIATKLGNDWFEVLVRLGLPVMELKGMGMTNHNDTIPFLLKKWRGRKSHEDDRGLIDLLVSLTDSSRIDIRKMVEKYLKDYVHQFQGWDTVDSPTAPGREDTFRRWLKQFRTTENYLQIDCKRFCQAISPFDDRFLFYVAEKIVNKDEIALGLGLTNSKYEDMKHIQPPSRRMCEMLAVLKAKEREDPPCDFIRQLLKEIKFRGDNNIALAQIEEKIRDWYQRGAKNIPPRNLEDIKKRIGVS